MTREENLAELRRLEAEMASFINKVEGWFAADRGYQPNQLVQARNRLKESVMWTEAWINSDT